MNALQLVFALAALAEHLAGLRESQHRCTKRGQPVLQLLSFAPGPHSPSGSMINWHGKTTSYHGRVETDRWWSLSELNAEAPDHHHDSTVENLACIYDASDTLRCFRKQQVVVAEINDAFLHDDPDDIEGVAKIESIRSTIRTGTPLPAIVLVHTPTGNSPWATSTARGRGFYQPLEGLHRYNAARRERTPTIYSWVAHVGCCGGPSADVVGVGVEVPGRRDE